MQKILPQKTSHTLFYLLGPVGGMGRMITNGVFHEAERQQTDSFILSLSSKHLEKHMTPNLAGAIFCSSFHKELVLKTLPAIPVFNLAGSGGPRPYCGNLLSDDPAVGQMAANYLLHRGYRNFFCIGLKGAVTHDLRAQAFRDTLVTAGFHSDIHQSKFHSKSKSYNFFHYQLEMQKILKEVLSGLQPGTAIFCTNDELALVTINALKSELPDHFDTCAVMGADNDAGLSRYLGPIPKISSVQPGFRQMGTTAIRWLLEHHREPDAAYEAQSILKYFPPVCVYDRASTATSGCTDPVTAGAIRWTWENIRLQGKLTVTDIARAHGLNRKNLERRFSLHAHTSPGDMIVQMRMDLAASLLRDTSLSIAEISHRCGFAKQDVLSRAIRRQYDCTPKALRQASSPDAASPSSTYLDETKWVPAASKTSTKPAPASIRQS